MAGRALFILSVSILFSQISSAQEQLAFKKHGFTRNILANHKLVLEFPVESVFIMDGDRYTDVEAEEKPRFFFNAAAAVGFKNKSGYGITAGTGLEYSTWGYWSQNFILDLRYFGGYFGNGKHKGSVFMFNKFVLNRIKSKDESGSRTEEYYLRLNIFEYGYANVLFTYGFAKGIMRKKYYPYYRNGGMMFTLGYLIK